VILPLAFTVSCSNSTKTTNGQIPLKNFFKNSIALQFRLSPNGQKIAALRPYKNRMNVFVADFGKENWKPLTKFIDRDVYLVGWKSNDVILFAKDTGGNENYHILSANLNTKEIKDLTPDLEEKATLVDMLDGVSETNILVATNKRLKTVSDIYDINVYSGAAKIVLENPGQQTSWVTDHKGQIRIAVETDDVNETFLYRQANDKPFKKVKTYNFKEAMQPVVFDKDNKLVFALSNIGTDKKSLVKINPETFKSVEQVYANDNYDINNVFYSKERNELIAAAYEDWKSRKKVFSPFYKKIFEDIEAKLPNKEISLTSSNKEETVFTVYAGSDRSRGMYYTYDSKAQKLDFLLNPSPWLKEEQLAEMKPIKYKSRDGLTIEGYLTLPVGKETAKGLPLVVNPHGGPWYRDSWGYNPEVQFLANRGFAVLQMNFRGSTGYGKKFWMSSFKQWGQKMQNDITDGVKWAIDQGIAKEDKICIYGASYGGYATLAGMTYTPDLYKCGVDYVGVSNLFTFQETIPPYWEPMRAMIQEMVGHPVKDKKMLTQFSPVFHADKIKGPLFVAQGANDPRVKKAESDQIVKALKDKGIDVPYMVKDNEGHGFQNEENRFEFYGQMEAFLNKHINN
jgi:dipeptidyl aminopeptidase/acylaminoacyl peptidase